jgi:hypothetical protein
VHREIQNIWKNFWTFHLVDPPNKIAAIKHFIFIFFGRANVFFPATLKHRNDFLRLSGIQWIFTD